MDWSALPPGALARIDEVRNILADKRLSDQETSDNVLAKILFKQNKESIERFTQIKEPVINKDCVEEVLIDDEEEEEHDDDVEIIDEPPSKHAKLTCEDLPSNDSSSINGNKFAEILENGIKIEETIVKISQVPHEIQKSIFLDSCSLISEKGLLNLTEFIKNTPDSPQSLLTHCLAPSITRVETLPRPLSENLEIILEKIPFALHSVTTAALVANKHADFCLDILQPLANQSHVKTILLSWIPKVEINESSLGFLERLLSMSLRVLEEEQVTRVVLAGLAKEAEGQSKSPKFAKFLLFLIKNLPNAVSRENYDRVGWIVSKNKTFLRKAMENNLKKTTVIG